MATLSESKDKLNNVMNKGRVHWYKPIQIAEILYNHRIKPSFDLNDLESYRTTSKSWRDSISMKLVGRVSTSSARYQDNIFEENAIPPEYLAVLAEENEKATHSGIVESYIYASMAKRLDALSDRRQYLFSATTESFQLKKFMDGFEEQSGLKRSIDKAYEIVVYALFNTLVQHLQATVTVSIAGEKKTLLKEFEDFTRIVLGLDSATPQISKPASLSRVGVTNAADRGLDIWANFGPAIQVKHISLDSDKAKGMVDEIADNAMIVIVCRTADSSTIKNVLYQAGFSSRVQGVVTLDDLIRWYDKCMDKKYATSLGEDLLEEMRKQFEMEFPSSGSVLADFQAERGYNRIKLDGTWKVE